MNESRNNVIEEFKDKDYRESYAEDYLNSFIAIQFRVIREQRKITQEELAQAIHTKQTAISRLENINNRSRNLNFLQKAAFALGCRLRVSLETFGSLINEEAPQFSREMLQRPSFEDEFGSPKEATMTAAATANATRVKLIQRLAPSSGQTNAQPPDGVRSSLGLSSPSTRSYPGPSASPLKLVAGMR